MAWSVEIVLRWDINGIYTSVRALCVKSNRVQYADAVSHTLFSLLLSLSSFFITQGGGTFPESVVCSRSGLYGKCFRGSQKRT